MLGSAVLFCLSWTVGNFLYQVFGPRNWESAIESSLSSSFAVMLFVVLFSVTK